MIQTHVLKRKSPGEVFREKNALPAEELNNLEAGLSSREGDVHQAAVDKGFLEKGLVLSLLSREWGIPAVDFDHVEAQADCVRLLPEAAARKGRILLFSREDNEIMAAMADPSDFSVVEDVQARVGVSLRLFLAMPGDIARELNKVHGDRGNSSADEDMRAAAQESAQNILDTLRETSGEVERMEEKTDVMEVNTSAPEVEKIINASIITALQQRASDIHFEPFEDVSGKSSRLVARLRVDGILRETPFRIPWAYRHAVLAKIKVMTGTMNITERRVPQSGRIQVMAKGRPIELRVETIPTIFGESASLRILDRANVHVNIERLGLQTDLSAKFKDLLKGVGGKKNYGMVLVTGPTGSGKSTTLYAALNHINRPGIRIITAENPVEYHIDGIIQVSVNPDVRLGHDKKFDFANALRSFLRADPDVIMVGEIRDQDTARIAMEAAMTGHLVFATLHTNDAPSTVARLVEMGVPGYMVTGTVKCVLSQRLCREICPQCRAARALSPEEKAVFAAHQISPPDNATLYEGRGCEACGKSGFKGRLGIHELMVMDETVRRSALTDMSMDGIRRAAQAGPQRMRTLTQDGLFKVLRGQTTLREVLGESLE